MPADYDDTVLASKALPVNGRFQHMNGITSSATRKHREVTIWSSEKVLKALVDAVDEVGTA